jgi:hypothetical protein
MRRVVEMLEAGLLYWKHIQPWACDVIASLDSPPAWVCELASLQYNGHLSTCLRGFVFSPPFEAFDEDALADYAVACVVLLYERRALSWASTLRRAGELSDSRDCGSEPCEFYYQFLNELEDSEYDPEVERRQVGHVRELLADKLALVAADFEPFLEAFRRVHGTKHSNRK